MNKKDSLPPIGNIKAMEAEALNAAAKSKEGENSLKRAEGSMVQN